MNYPKYVKIPDEKSEFSRVVKIHHFPDTQKPYYFEPNFKLSTNGYIVRCDTLFEFNQLIESGFKPCTLREYRDYCRSQYKRFYDDEVFVNPFALMCGKKEPKYNDKMVTSPKYFL